EGPEFASCVATAVTLRPDLAAKIVVSELNISWINGRPPQQTLSLSAISQIVKAAVRAAPKNASLIVKAAIKSEPRMRDCIIAAATAAAPEREALSRAAVGTAATSAPSSAPVDEMSAESSVPILTPAADSNLYSSNDLRNEVSAEPRRFQYGFKVTVRGVYDDNINISQTNRVSDYYFSIEPVLTLGLGDITGAGDNYIRLDYSPALFLFADHSEDDAVQHLIR